MKTSQLLRGLAAIAILAAAPIGLMAAPFGVSAVQAAEARVGFNIFFGELKPHGVWVKHPRYRYVFCPRVNADWRPYTHGHWVYLRDRGWYFQSREPFAWAVYHYGRWIDDNRLGWCWVPGTHWAPAWVSWRRSNDYIGWAPLPPEHDGFSIDINVNVGEPPERDWVFVPTRRFVEPELSVSIEFGDRSRDRFRDTEYVGPVTIQNNVVINNNIDINFIQQQTNTEVKIVDAQPADNAKATEAEASADSVPVFAPTVEEPTKDEAPEAAVEPEKAAEELGRPPEGEQAPADQGATPVEGEQAPADAATPTEQPADGAKPAEAAPADQAAPAPEQPAEPVACPEGQQLVDGKCVPIEQPAPAEEKAPAAEQPAAPAEEPAPAADQPAAPAAEPAAPAEEPAPPVEEQSAPTEEQAAPAEDQAAPEPPLQCPEGQVIVDGKCVPADQAPAQ